MPRSEMAPGARPFGARRGGAGAALALAMTLGLGGCAGLVGPEPGAPVPPPPPRTIDPQAQTTVIAAYRAACLETPLDLSGAEEALMRMGFAPAAANQGEEDIRIYAKGDVEAELRIGPQRPVVVSNCLISSPSLDRDASLAAVETAIVASGLRYEARDLAKLGDPRAHDVRGTAVGSDFWGVVSVIDVKGVGGAAVLKTPPKRD